MKIELNKKTIIVLIASVVLATTLYPVVKKHLSFATNRYWQNDGILRTDNVVESYGTTNGFRAYYDASHYRLLSVDSAGRWVMDGITFLNGIQYGDDTQSLTTSTDLSAVSGACWGQIYNNIGASAGIEIELPAAVKNMTFSVRVSVAHTIKLDPNGTDRIDVLTSANGDYLLSDATIGTVIQLKCEVAHHWVLWGMSGSWTEE